jgi:hypothetical protein
MVLPCNRMLKYNIFEIAFQSTKYNRNHIKTEPRIDNYNEIGVQIELHLSQPYTQYTRG